VMRETPTAMQWLSNTNGPARQRPSLTDDHSRLAQYLSTRHARSMGIDIVPIIAPYARSWSFGDASLDVA
jgi:hypothetical protein